MPFRSTKGMTIMTKEITVLSDDELNDVVGGSPLGDAITDSIATYGHGVGQSTGLFHNVQNAIGRVQAQIQIGTALRGFHH